MARRPFLIRRWLTRLLQPAAVVAYLGEHRGAGEHGKTGEARDDLRVGMLEEELLDFTCEILAGPACRVELGEQSKCPAPHRRFHQGRLA
ncbi:hypothetical protein ACWFR5_14485 [Streptomyces sp. NPDC055092]